MPDFFLVRLFLVSSFLVRSSFLCGCDDHSIADGELSRAEDSAKLEDELGDWDQTGDCIGDDCHGGDREPEDEWFEFEELSCRGMHLCKHCCTAGPCFRACEEAGTPERLADLQAMYYCTGVTCKTACGLFSTDKKCDDCIESKCAEEIDSCNWNSVGAMTCRKLSDCLNECGSILSSGTAKTCTENEALWCINGCFGNASQISVDKFTAYDLCAWSSCGAECVGSGASPGEAVECNECLNSKCGVELNACVAD